MQQQTMQQGVADDAAAVPADQQQSLAAAYNCMGHTARRGPLPSPCASSWGHGCDTNSCHSPSSTTGQSGSSTRTTPRQPGAVLVEHNIYIYTHTVQNIACRPRVLKKHNYNRLPRLGLHLLAVATLLEVEDAIG